MSDELTGDEARVTVDRPDGVTEIVSGTVESMDGAPGEGVQLNDDGTPPIEGPIERVREMAEEAAAGVEALGIDPHVIWGFPNAPIMPGPWGMQCRRRAKADPTDLAEEEHFDFNLSNPGGTAEIIATKKELLRTLKSVVAWLEGDDSHGFGGENSPIEVLNAEAKAAALAATPEGVERFVAASREDRRGNLTHPRRRP